MLFYNKGSVNSSLTREDLKEGLYEALAKLGDRRKVVAIPPDITRLHSQSGVLTEYVWQYYKDRLTDILPSIGTHVPMTGSEIGMMFGKTPKNLFRVHDWRDGFVTLGEVPSEYVHRISEGSVDYSIPIQVDKLVAQGGHDLILSVGQVVPHEVIGMANHNKNVFIGTGGREGINKSHFLGAAYGLERIMGRADTPVKRVLNYGSDHFAKHLPIVYVLTVVDKDESNNTVVRGLFIGDDLECFNLAAALSLKVNFYMVEQPLKKVIVYLDPTEFKSTWLGNKSVYRTRMAIADGGELIVLAPGLKTFGEDKGIDGLIRKYGYVGTPRVLDMVKKNDDLKGNLSAAAHLIHGSSEGRFSITYCPGHISKQELEGVNFGYGELSEMIKKYDPKKLKEGMNRMPDGEEVFYISNPALGLWAHKDRFQ
ncbi:MAG: lactate racemase domain-containing protein [Bacteroidetes bacterium]|nr:lactate racemase domain-containing protein [Bacteroidota bacterium]